jgi:branched-subunit amino acid transport protein
VNIWLIVLAAGAITYATRLSFILLFSRLEIPRWLQVALRFVPPAVLTAIFLPELVVQGGALDLTLGNDRLLAGGLAILVAWRTKNVVLTILVGMAGLWVLQVLN